MMGLARKDGFICCPSCGKKTKVKVYDNTSMSNFPLYCPWCKRENIVDIEPEPGARALRN